MTLDHDPSPGGSGLTSKKEQSETGAEIIAQLRVEIENVYQANRKIEPSKVFEIRDLLARVPNLVVNFDDTITKAPEADLENPENGKSNYSIRSICNEIINLAEQNQALIKNASAAAQFLTVLDGVLPREELGAGSVIEYFYTRVLGGLPEETVNLIYDRVVNNDDPRSAITLNQNFIEAVRIVSEVLGVKQISIFVLSINTPDLMRKWYAKNLPLAQERLDQLGVKIKVIETMGNQIVWQESGGLKEVAGITEHVTDGNKYQYIPYGDIMLADDRETIRRAEDFVNVVNIEDGKFIPQLVRLASVYYTIAQSLRNSGYRVNENQEVTQAFDNLTIVLKNLVICHENKDLTIAKRSLPYLNLSKEKVTDSIIEEEIAINESLFAEKRNRLEQLLARGEK